MNSSRNVVIFMVFVLLLATLACGIAVDPPEVDIPEGLAETAEAAAQQAGDLGGTAVAIATEQAAGAVGTVAAGGLPGDVPDINALNDKFSNLSPDAEGNYQVTITDDEVNQVLRAKEQAAAEGGQEQGLANAFVTFTGGNIILVGDVTQPIAAQLTVTFRPYIENGAVQFEVMSATLGSLQVPDAVLGTAELTLNATLGEAFNQMPGNVELTGIEMGEGTMTVMGKKAG